MRRCYLILLDWRSWSFLETPCSNIQSCSNKRPAAEQEVTAAVVSSR